MKRVNVESFINYGVNKELNAKQLKSMVFGISIFYLIGIFYGLMLGGTECIFGMAILIVTFISNVYIIRKSKVLSLKNYCIVLGTISLETTINFMMFSLILNQMLEADMLLNIVILFTPLLTMIIYIIITNSLITSGAFLNVREVKRKNIKLYSLMGSVAGIFIARSVLSDIGKKLY